MDRFQMKFDPLKFLSGVVHWTVAGVVALVISVILMMIYFVSLQIAHERDVTRLQTSIKECIDERTDTRDSRNP
jgi:hypothetical protein